LRTSQHILRSDLLIRLATIALIGSTLIPSAIASDGKKVIPPIVTSGDSCASLRSELNVLQQKKTAVDRLLADYVVQARSAPSDPQLKETNVKLSQEYAEYRIYLMHYAERGYYWELVSSWVILALVAIVVLTGLSFSGYQLYKSFHFAVVASQFPTGAGATASSQPPPLDAQIKLSAHEIQITSSVVGLIVLAFSLVFLYLFILHVYPITSAGAENTVTNSAHHKA
jgi:hypothetical protein